MKKVITILICAVAILAIVSQIAYLYLGSAHSGGKYYSSPERQVEQLSTEYYLGPTINENNSKISNVVHYEILDGVFESASPIGYYIQFIYKENEIDCEITIMSQSAKGYKGDIQNSNIYLYQNIEIYLYDFLDEERNIISRQTMAVLGDYVCNVTLPAISPNDIKFERYRELSLEFMFELIDNYKNRNID